MIRLFRILVETGFPYVSNDYIVNNNMKIEKFQKQAFKKKKTFSNNTKLAARNTMGPLFHLVH